LKDWTHHIPTKRHRSLSISREELRIKSATGEGGEEASLESFSKVSFTKTRSDRSACYLRKKGCRSEVLGGARRFKNFYSKVQENV